jgi:hypothetical protein
MRAPLTRYKAELTPDRLPTASGSSEAPRSGRTKGMEAADEYRCAGSYSRNRPRSFRQRKDRRTPSFDSRHSTLRDPRTSVPSVALRRVESTDAAEVPRRYPRLGSLTARSGTAHRSAGSYRRRSDRHRCSGLSPAGETGTTAGRARDRPHRARVAARPLERYPHR